jgi:cell division inhibitor SepF
MSALRKAGVWLGLVEEEDETVDDSFDDEFGDDEDFVPSRPRALARPTSRLDRDRDRGRDRDRDTDRAVPRPVERPAERELRVPERRVDYDSRPAVRDRVPDRTYDRALDRAPERAPDRPVERASVRPLSRPATTGGVPTGTGSTGAYPTVPVPAPRPQPTTAGGGTTTSFPTQDNLALAPQVQLRERAVVNDDSTRRHQITTLHPTTYSEARTIGEHFRDGYPVIMNLTEMDEPDAKRLVDFAAGLAFGMRGSMERVTNRVFLLSPPNIHVSAEDKARIAEGGFTDRP